MSFFDEGDEPPTKAQRPRRTPGATRPGGGARPRSAAAGTPEAVRNRRIVALVIGVLVFILLAIVVNSCLDNRAQNRLKDYNRDVGEVVSASDREVGKPLFEALSAGGQAPNELEQNINQLRVVAERQIDTAEGFDVPDELKNAQRNLLLALDLRATAVAKIASEVRTALARSGGDQADAAVDQIAAQNQALLASDVIYDARVIPFIREAFEDKSITGQEITDSQFLPNLDWLQPATVSDRLGAAGGGGAGTSGTPAPGLHGHGLVSTAVGDVTLQPGETANRIPAGANIVFTVTFANQGENNEENVPVRIRIRGAGKPITATRRVEQTTPGQNAEAEIPLDQAPPIGVPVTIEVTVEKVPGEEKTDNNKQSYTAIFTR